MHLRSAAVLAGLFCSACASGRSPGLVAPTGPSAAARLGAVSGEAVPERYLPTFDALDRALADGADREARWIHDRLEARLSLEEEAGLEGAGEALAILEAYGQVLGGRERLAEIELGLRGRLDRERGVLQVLLQARSSWETPLTLVPGPSTLSHRDLELSPDGRESWQVRTTQVTPPSSLLLAPGQELEVLLVELPARHPAGAIAVRRTLVLELRAGEVREGDEAFPAVKPRVRELDWRGIAPWLPSPSVEPAELLRYVEERERPGPRPLDPKELAEHELERARFTASLLERAVRIEPRRQVEALDLLAPYVQEAALEDVQRIAPALRWLDGRTGEARLEPERWKRYLELRQGGAGRGDAAAPTTSGLDLPGRPSRD